MCGNLTLRGCNIFFIRQQLLPSPAPPADLTADGGMLAVVDGRNGTASNVSIFDIVAEGELTLPFAVKISIAGPPFAAAARDRWPRSVSPATLGRALSRR